MASSEIAAWVAAAATFLAAIGALYAVWWQVRRQWFLHSASMVTSFLDRYMSEEWRKYRFMSAAALKRYASGVTIMSSDLPVLNFFENMGYLVHRRDLDKEMVWNQFGWYIVRYYFAMTRSPSFLEHERASGHWWTLWEEFEWLAIEMLKIYNKKGINVYTMTDCAINSRIEELLEEESWSFNSHSGTGL